MEAGALVDAAIVWQKGQRPINIIHTLRPPFGVAALFVVRPCGRPTATPWLAGTNWERPCHTLSPRLAHEFED